ncbi:MAG: amidohydrolase family protein, partial [Candidatus Binatia bacterium]
PPRYADDSLPIKIPDTEAQLRSMENWHIRAAITSLTPRVVLKNLGRLSDVARDCNEFQARMRQDQPSRFGSFALLPLPDVDGALDEIGYALDVLRLDGVGLFSSVNDRYLGDPLLDPVFDELNRAQSSRLHSSDALRSAGAHALARAAFCRRVRLRHNSRHCQPDLLRHA